MKTPKTNAETNDNIFTSGVNQLNPKHKIDIEPHADNNILKITNQCIYALTSTDRESAGRGSGAWWFIWMTVFLVYLFSYYTYLDVTSESPLYTMTENIIYGGGGLFIFILFTIPFFIRWRRVLPICFNRVTKKVSAWHKGKLYQADWDTLEAFAKTLNIVGTHVPYKQGIVAINLYHRKERLDVPVAGTEWQSITPQEASYMLWEYLRLFMEEGKQVVPAPNPVTNKELSDWKHAFKKHSPFPLIKKDSDTIIWIIIDLLFIPFNFIMAPISIPTELIFMGLDKALPKRKPPKDLLDACEDCS